jgi:hypothetical protein
MRRISPTLESDNNARGLTPRRPPVMIDATFKTAFRALVDELENATARCKARVESDAFDPDDFVEELSDLVDEILESEKAPKAGFLIVSVEALEALRGVINDLSGGDVERPFRDPEWEMRKAFREFREALTCEIAS